MLRLEARAQPSALMQTAAPLLALAATVVGGGILFLILGKNPFVSIRIIFWDPLFDASLVSYTRPQLLVKAAPLIMIALGLSFGFRAGIWNIGAEGQFVMGALAGSAVGLALHPLEAFWILPLMVLCGIAGGIAWAMIPALLRVYFRTNEILVSLMLVYVSYRILTALVTGPLRSPIGYNFPESRSFHDNPSMHNAELWSGTGIHIGILVAGILVVVCWYVMRRHLFGYHVNLMGQSNKVAGFAGVRINLVIICCLGITGALAGAAGVFEVTGPAGKLSPHFPVGYGFTAIIVAFLGRLNPIGILFAGLLMALTYIGGELAQFILDAPAAAIQVFQGMLLFFLVAADLLVNYRVKLAVPGGLFKPRPAESDAGGKST
ncbi:MAG: ABC transporter permease [Rhodobacteraceae bacterium]|nr:ABC transporter permease [Paracoccaceae bacterium]